VFPDSIFYIPTHTLIINTSDDQLLCNNKW